jgi:hypothetical protein
MYLDRFDVFENEEEVSRMIISLQRKGLENMVVPDEFWTYESHQRALNSAHEMSEKVLSAL